MPASGKTVPLERELLQTLTGAWTLGDLYAEIEHSTAATERAGGNDVIHGRTDARFSPLKIILTGH